MNGAIVSLSDLLGRRIHDVDGNAIGRIEELNADVELRDGSAEYVVTSVEVGRYDAVDTIASGWFIQRLVKQMVRATGYIRYDIPWDWIDLSDPHHPRALRPMSELPTTRHELR